jgi:hypothetical protein
MIHAIINIVSFEHNDNLKTSYNAEYSDKHIEGKSLESDFSFS